MYIITRKFIEDRQQKTKYLESHCAALVWKYTIEDAKRFKTKKEAIATTQRWKILEPIIIEV